MTPRLPALAITLALMVTGCQETPPPQGMVRVDGGPFIMGTNQMDEAGRAEELGLIVPWFENERPQRRFKLPTYFIDATEVTNGQYGRFVAQAGHRPPDHWRGATPPAGLEQHPVTHVDWFDADAYCRWDGNKALPTEAQWEKAARGKDGRIFPWGDTYHHDAVNVARGQTTPVGSLPAGDSPYGVKDMVGNVWEWTADWYQPYPGSSYESDKFGTRYRVLRGNSWASVGHYPDEDFMEIVANNSRPSYRLFLTPKGRLNDVGFRCVKPG